MPDKSKKNIYKKTMGFTHKNTTSYAEGFKRQIDFVGAKVKDTIQQTGLGKKEPHKFTNTGNFQRPTPSYNKTKYQGQVVGKEMSMLSTFGNKSTNNFDSSADRKSVV